MLHLPLSKAWLVGSSEARDGVSWFELTLDGGEVIYGSPLHILLSQQRTRVLVFAHTDRVIPRLKRVEWNEVVRLLTEVSEDERP
jgi:hypothetical protein